MEWIKKYWKDPVWSKVISVAVLSLFGWLGNWITKGWIISVIKYIWETVLQVLTYKIPIYWVLIIFVVIIGIIVLFSWYISIKSEDRKNSIPAYYEYTEDVFDDIPYRWESRDGKIFNLHKLCPKCKTPIVYSHCPRCNFSEYYGNRKSEEDILVLIADNVNRKYNKNYK